MSAPGLNLGAHWNQLAAAIGRDSWPVHDEGEVPGLHGDSGKTPERYYVLTVDRVTLPAARSSRQSTRTSWRAYVVAAAATASEVRQGQSHAALALDGAVVAIDGAHSTPIHHEGTRTPEVRQGRAECDSEWTYSL